MTEFIKVLQIDDLPVGKSQAVEVFGQSVLLCHTAEGVLAVANECTHQRTPLEGGRMRGCYIFCPLHGVRFDLRSGVPNGTLTSVPLECFETRINEGAVEIAQRK